MAERQKTAIVLGGGGFLGLHISRLFAASGYRTTAVGRFSIERRRVLESVENITIVEVSLDLEQLRQILREGRPTVVIHAAGTASVERSMLKPHQDYIESVGLMADVLEALRTESPESHLVFLSSASVYGQPSSLPITESTPVKPLSAYGYHKSLCEQLIEEHQHLFGLSASIARIFSTYGEWSRRQVVFDLCSRFNSPERNDEPIRGTGEEERDFLYVGDVARAIFMIARSCRAGVFNVASGSAVSISRLVDIVRGNFGTSAIPRFDGVVPAGTPLQWCADVSKLRELGFEPSVTLEKGVETTCRWFMGAYPSMPRVPTQTIEIPAVTVENERRRLRIAVPAVGNQSWLGGVTYVEFLFRALRTLPLSEQPELSLVIDDPERLSLYQETIIRADRVVFTGPGFSCLDAPTAVLPSGFVRRTEEEVLDEVDLYFPMQHHVVPHPSMAFWLWDFQHLFLPELFSEEEKHRRNALFAFFSRQPVVVTSSQDTAKIFDGIFPNRPGKTFVLPFHFKPDGQMFQQDSRRVIEKYGLGSRYFICCNQFWMHKNHIRVFEALAQLRKRGIAPQVVFTGQTSDSRNVDFFPSLMRYADSLGISDQLSVLGVLPREEQVQLIRGAIAMIQPSLFEGWSTVVEDARAFGKNILLSDIPVHREQNPPGATFFPPDDSNALATLMVGLWSDESSYPDCGAEDRARSESDSKISQYARKIIEIAMYVRSLKEEGARSGARHSFSEPVGNPPR